VTVASATSSTTGGREEPVVEEVALATVARPGEANADTGDGSQILMRGLD
jgi:hypothetical protein